MKLINTYTNPHFVATGKVFYNNALYKQAQDSGIVSHIKSVFDKTLTGNTPEEKGKSLIRFLEPGAIFVALSTLGFNKLAFFVHLAQSVFNISIYDIAEDIFNKLKQIINNKKPVTQQQAESIVQEAVAKNYTEPSEEQYERAKTASIKQNILNKKISNKDIRTVKLLLKFAEQDLQLKKQADGKKSVEPGLLSKILSNFNTFKQGKSSFVRSLISLFTTILTIGLASAGFLIVGRALQDTLGVGQDSKKSYFSGSEPTATQTKYQQSATKEVPTDTWFISIPELSDPKTIGNLIVKFVTDTYPQTKGKENLIKSTAGFSVILNDILFENRNFLGTHNVYIPSKYPKKSTIANLIIDEVAELDKPA